MNLKCICTETAVHCSAQYWSTFFCVPGLLLSLSCDSKLCRTGTVSLFYLYRRWLSSRCVSEAAVYCSNINHYIIESCIQYRERKKKEKDQIYCGKFYAFLRVVFWCLVGWLGFLFVWFFVLILWQVTGRNVQRSVMKFSYHFEESSSQWPEESLLSSYSRLLGAGYFRAALGILERFAYSCN